jgi:hypothetical protein
MAAGVDQEVHMLGAMMNGVETPKERNLVAPAMAPVKSDLADDHGRNHARPERQGARRPSDGARKRRVDEPGDQKSGRAEKKRGEEAVEEIPAEIDRPPLREQLPGTNGEDMLERRERLSPPPAVCRPAAH